MKNAPIDNLIVALKKLPSVGQKTAERFVYHWLISGKKEVNDLKNSLDELLSKVKSCEICWNFTTGSPCQICSDNKRDKTIICVVAEAPDIASIEKTDEFNGVYHVLRGLIDFTDDEPDFEKIKAKELFQRIKKNNTKEVILALNPDLAGETMAMYLEKEIKIISPKIKITRLARGLPLGSDLQYADEITLGSALKNRR